MRFSAQERARALVRQLQQPQSMRTAARSGAFGLVVILSLAGCYLSNRGNPHGDPCEESEQDQDGDGWGDCSDCDDLDPSVNPGVALDGGCCGQDGKDNDCDGTVDEDLLWCDLECPADLDGDGYLSPEDCNDYDPSVHPGMFDASDPCSGSGNGIDDDCDGSVDEDWIGEPQGGCDFDGDGDGWPAATDCDDTDPAKNPGRVEYCCPCGNEAGFEYPDCNGADDDCDGVVDEVSARDMEEDEFCCSWL